MKHRLSTIFAAFLLFLSPLAVYADDLTDLDYNLGGPLLLIMHVIKIMLWIGGSGLLLGSVAQYQAHRKNPSQVRLTRPVLLFIVGTVFILLPFFIQYGLQNTGM